MPSNGDWLIQGQGLSKTYRGGKRPALEGASVQVASGEILGVIGPNGAGKTTLMACLLGLLRPDQGTVSLGGHAVESLEAKRWIGYLPERLRFDPWMRGWDFVAYHQALSGRPASRREADVAEALAQVGLDQAAWHRPIKGYSRGMLQRVGLAQALVGRPRYLFLDEPTSGMDPDGALATRSLIQTFAADGGAVVVNSHQLEQLGKLCHKVVFLKQGRVEATEQWAGPAGLRWSLRWLDQPGAKAKAAGALEKLGLEGVTLAKGGLQASVADTAGAAELLKAMVKAGVAVTHAGPLQGDLEKFFHGGGDAVE
jgi:ABC-2 type transport system ATP-binding protein